MIMLVFGRDRIKHLLTDCYRVFEQLTRYWTLIINSQDAPLEIPGSWELDGLQMFPFMAEIMGF